MIRYIKPFLLLLLITACQSNPLEIEINKVELQSSKELITESTTLLNLNGEIENNVISSFSGPQGPLLPPLAPLLGFPEGYIDGALEAEQLFSELIDIYPQYGFVSSPSIIYIDGNVSLNGNSSYTSLSRNYSSQGGVYGTNSTNAFTSTSQTSKGVKIKIVSYGYAPSFDRDTFALVVSTKQEYRDVFTPIFDAALSGNPYEVGKRTGFLNYWFGLMF